MPPLTGPDVLVVGAGPAGSTVAQLLARVGWEVILLDRARFPRSKACGESINPGAVATLQRLGLLDRVLAESPSPIRGWTLRTAGGKAATGRFARGESGGLGIPRRKLDTVLVRAARRAGAQLEERVRVIDVALGQGKILPTVTTLTASGCRAVRRARVVVGADGLRSVVSRRAGMLARPPRIRKASITFHLRGARVPADTGTLFLDEGLTAGLAPVGEGGRLWNCTLVARVGTPYARMLSAEPDHLLALGIAGLDQGWLTSPELVAGPWGSGPFDWPTRRMACGDVFLVGDAAGYFDPLTGQGIYRALRSAELAAASIDRILRDPSMRASETASYQRSVRREFRPGRWLQRLIEEIFSRRRLRELAVERLSRASGSLSELLRVTGDHAPLSRLARPAFWVPLLLSSSTAKVPAREGQQKEPSHGTEPPDVDD
jgi:flavin-dependent dehydrogenase